MKIVNATDPSIDLTIIVLSYNNAAYVSECLNSIMFTSGTFEIIIHDDGSTDNSVDLIANFISESSHDITFLKSDENIGIVKSYNKCLKVARGRYISHIASDDVCYLDRFDKQYLVAKADDSLIAVTGNMQLIDASGVFLKLAKSNTNQVCEKLKVGLPAIFSPTLFYKRSIIDEFGLLPEFLINEDDALSHRIAQRPDKIVHLDRTLVKYRKIINSASSGENTLSPSKYLSWLLENLPHQINNLDYGIGISNNNRSVLLSTRKEFLNQLLIMLKQKGNRGIYTIISARILLPFMVAASFKIRMKFHRFYNKCL